jgi:hypothetical protein
LTTAPHRTNFTYRVWNHTLVSDFDLGELETGNDVCDAGELISILRLPEDQWPQPGSQPLFEDHLDNDEVWFASWKAENGYIIQFPERCNFYIQPREMRIDCAPAHGAAESTIAHLILDHAIPRLLSLTPGFLVFHASAIQVEDRVIAILGKSGQGKSTLAGWFASQGFPLLTDDCLVVRWSEATQQWLAQPSYHSVRLWPDSVDALGIADSDLREFAGYSRKKRTGREVDFRFASAGAPLAACFVLPDPATPTPAHSGPPELLPLSVNEAFPKLAGAVFRIDPADPEINRREFEVLTSLASTVRFWSLHYERKYHWLPAVQKAIIKAVRDENRPQKDLP